jgi:hypothetical protein
MRCAILAVLLAAVPARASAPQGGNAAFAVAYGAAVYAVVADPNSATDSLVVRKLSLDGGVEWERSYTSGQNETPVGAAVTASGGVSVAGDNDNGCFAVHFSKSGLRSWASVLQYGSECHVRAIIVDATGDTYVLATTTDDAGFEPSVWKVSKTGALQWSYRLNDSASRYAFALTLDAAGDGVTTTDAVSGAGGWMYDSFDIDAAGRPRALQQ